jgi:hypothetical protein
VVRWTGCCGRLEACCVWVASLVGVIYGLVGMCSGARRITSFLLGKKVYRIMSCLYVNILLGEIFSGWVVAMYLLVGVVFGRCEGQYPVPHAVWGGGWDFACYRWPSVVCADVVVFMAVFTLTVNSFIQFKTLMCVWVLLVCLFDGVEMWNEMFLCFECFCLLGCRFMQLEVTDFSHVTTHPPPQGMTFQEVILRVTAVRTSNLTFIICYCVWRDGAQLIFLLFVLWGISG